MGRTARRRPWRWIARPAYAACIEAELAAHRAVDRLAPLEQDVDDLTVMVKTFERPAVLARLVASIRRLYPRLSIIVVDDSRLPSRLEGVETVVLPFDSGVSAGRNAGLERVTTPFFLLCDDDFVFFRGTCLAPPLRIMRDHAEIDLVGGVVVDLPLYRRVDTGARRALGASGPPPKGTIGGLARREFLRNFYVGRTERVRTVAWDDRLKRVDHSDFFGRAHGVLRAVEDPRLAVLHAPTPFDSRYMAHREDVAVDMALLRLRWHRRR